MMFPALLCACLGITFASAAPGASASTGAGGPADLVITHARIYTADASRVLAESLAVRSGRIVFVGSNESAKGFIGPSTRIQVEENRLILPGLFDAHLHPIAMIKVDNCDLGAKPMSLRELSSFARD